MRNWIVKCIAAACTVLIVISVYLYTKEDRTAPKITIPDTTVTYKVGDAEDVLLEGVTAIDDEDGDVTDTLIIASVLPSDDKKSAVVLYVAKDAENNMAEKRREVVCEENTGNPEVDDAAEPAADGEEAGLTSEEETALAVRAAQEALPPENPRLTLKATEKKIKAGEPFEKLAYIKEITDDNDTKDELYGNIRIQGDYNTDMPGSYELTYEVVDKDGNHSNEAKLILIVE